MWFIGVEVERETSAPPPKKNPGFAPGIQILASDYQIKNNKIKQYECEPSNKKKRTAQSLHLNGHNVCQRLHPDTL